MKIVSATDFARQARAVFDRVMAEREPVTVERNGRAVAHLIPATREITAREALIDLYGILDPKAGKIWLKDARGAGKDGVIDPWVS